MQPGKFFEKVLTRSNIMIELLSKLKIHHTTKFWNFIWTRLKYVVAQYLIHLLEFLRIIQSVSCVVSVSYKFASEKFREILNILTFQYLRHLRTYRIIKKLYQIIAVRSEDIVYDGS